MLYKTIYYSPFGKIHLVADDHALIGAWIDGQQHFAKKIVGEAVEVVEKSTACPSNFTIHESSAKNVIFILSTATSWLDRYFNGEQPNIDELPLAPQGSQFRQDVWKILKEIPYGETITYGDIAKKLALQYGKERMSAQAVGGAVGHNPLSIIIPCHRVVGTGGNLTGYAGGVDLKVRLLEHEGVDMSDFWYKNSD